MKTRTLVERHARAGDIEIRQVNCGERKEAAVGENPAARGRREGAVCIPGATERRRRFKAGKNQTAGFLQFQRSPGKRQRFCVRLLDGEFGLCRLRTPARSPFRLQFCCNGAGAKSKARATAPSSRIRPAGNQPVLAARCGASGCCSSSNRRRARGESLVTAGLRLAERVIVPAFAA